MNKKFCVYTVLMGDHEILNEQPVAKDSNVDFICFTDNKDISSKSWKLVFIDPVFPLDLARSSRVPKICPHRFLPEYDSSLYIDNSIVLKKIPETILNELFDYKKYDFVCIKHSYRETLLDEFIQVARQQFDNLNVIAEQLNTYYLSIPNILNEKPLKGGFLLRNHNKPVVIQVMEEWLAHVLRYSRRDQLSLNYVLNGKKILLHKLDIDVRNTDYFTWPVRQERNMESYKNSGMLSTLLMSKISQTDQKAQVLLATIAEKELRIQTLLKESAEKAQTIQILLEKNAKMEQDVITLLEKNTEKEQGIKTLHTTNTLQEQEIQLLTGTLAEKELLINGLEAELTAIKETRSWKFIQPFRKLWFWIKQ